MLDPLDTVWCHGIEVIASVAWVFGPGQFYNLVSLSILTETGSFAEIAIVSARGKRWKLYGCERLT